MGETDEEDEGPGRGRRGGNSAGGGEQGKDTSRSGDGREDEEAMGSTEGSRPPGELLICRVHVYESMNVCM